MIHVLLPLLASAPIADQANDQAFFAILAETKMMRMAGVELMRDIPDLPPGFKMPAGMEMMTGKPSRILNMRLWSPSIAPKEAFAYVEPPAGLKQGKKLDLELYRPTAAEPGKRKGDVFDPDATPEFTIKMYWGSSETVREGQPRVIEWKGLTAEQKAAMRQMARDAQAESDYFYKPDWTTAFWPTKKQPGQIDAAASLVGTYTLTTNYCGNVAIDAPQNVNFLAPYEITAPDLEKKVDLTKALKFQWKSIPYSLGQSASIVAMEGKNTLIMWSSSEVFVEGLMGDMGFLQMSEVRDFVERTIFMAGERTAVDVPAGIFKEADFVMMNMVGYGPGAALDKAQPLPRIQAKSTLSIMLGGKKMRGF
ncbi:MAG: hypothetical protein IT363_12975 [Methanoregulaceae archaeon]|nr:hypothetical protein [Methanoregulaceae archaeon]